MSAVEGCRVSGSVLAPSSFRSIACANCLFFLYLVVPPYPSLYSTRLCPDGLLICPLSDSPLHCHCGNVSKLFNVPEFALNSSLVSSVDALSLSPPLPAALPFLTRECCEDAWRCCEAQLNEPSPVEGQCPRTWDGWGCWSSSPPGDVFSLCPAFIFGDRRIESSAALSRKRCEADGRWFRVTHDTLEQEWTDYSDCAPLSSSLNSLKLALSVAAFGLSALTLGPSVVVLSRLRSLRSQPVFAIHRHLLLSLLLSSLVFLFNSLFFVVGPGQLLFFTNHWWCRVQFSVQLRYLRLTSYAWMLSEGVHLFRLLHNVFSEPESLLPYKVFCWGFPLVPTIVYSILRATLDNESCWATPSVFPWLEWTIAGPGLVALCANFLLLSLILFILIKKLRVNPHLEPVQYRKAVRAAFMLAPIFGVQSLAFLYRIPSPTHQIVNLVFDGLQGFFCSIVLFYSNQKVMEGVKKWVWSRRENRSVGRSTDRRDTHTALTERAERGKTDDTSRRPLVTTVL